MTDAVMLYLALLLTVWAFLVARTCWRDGYRGEAVTIAAISVPFPVLAVLSWFQLLQGVTP